MKLKIHKKEFCSFTLAELLIGIGLVGIVSALIIPGFINNFNTKLRTRKIEMTEAKLKQGMDKLMVLGHINGYNSTLEFVKELSKHMKIITYCSAEELNNCWPYESIKLPNNSELSVWRLKSLNNFQLDPETWAEPVGFVTADGTAYLIAYNKKCAIDENDSRSDYKECIAGIYDWNGNKAPNRYGAVEGEHIVPDVIPIGSVALFANTCAIELKKDKLCFAGQIISPTKMAYEDCMEQKDELGLRYCASPNDYYAGVVKKCHDMGGRMPTRQDAEKLHEAIKADSSISANFIKSRIFIMLNTEYLIRGEAFVNTYYIPYSSASTGYHGYGGARTYADYGRGLCLIN